MTRRPMVVRWVLLCGFMLGTILVTSVSTLHAQPACGTWTLEDDFAGPRFFRMSGIMYDTSRIATTMLHWPDEGDASEVWSWSGAEWALIDSGGPPANGAAVYDSARDVVVLLVEGDNEDGPGETWEWDGDAWMLVSEDGPASRIHQRVVYDTQRGVTILFGGYDSGYLGDTWTWDGATWTLMSETGPSPRWAHDMVYDVDRNVTALFGGITGAGRVADTWEWNGAQWTQVSDGGPSPRASHAMSYDVERGVTVLYGGSSPQELRDTWHWDGVAWTLIDSNGPGGSSYRMSFDPARRLNVLVGGGLGVDTSLWDGSEWTVQIPDQPAPGMHDMVWDSDREVGVLCESHSVSDTSVRKTWVLDRDGWTLASQSSPTWSGPMVYDAARGVVLMFNFVGQTWAWDGDAWSMVAGNGPAEVSAMAFDEARGVVVAFGSYNRGRGETWEWDGESWTLRSTGGPRYRTGTSMVYDPATGITMMFGGVHHTSEDSVFYNDTWAWNGSVWRQVSATGPSPRADHSMVLDSTTGFVLLHGGDMNGKMSGEFWAWDGRVWHLLSLGAGPSPRVASAMIYDTTLHRARLFGGRDTDVIHGDLWDLDVLGSAPALSVTSACPATGPGEITWTCATPFGRVLVAYAERPGMFAIPPSIPCAGVQLGLERATLRLVGTAFTSSRGDGAITGEIPAGACDGSLQMIDVERCRVSNVVTIE